MFHDSAMATVERVAGEPAPAPNVLNRLLRRRDGRTPLWIELAIVGWLFYLYDVINDLAPTRQRLALTNATGLLHFEQSVGIAIERSLDRWLSAHSALAFVATYYYFLAHVLVTFGVLAWLWWRHSPRYPRIRAQLVIINLIAFVVFWRYPLAPPRMLGALGYRDVIASVRAGISWHSAALSSDADQYAAMPSLHLAWAIWCGLAIWRVARAPLVRAFGVLHPALTTVVVIATGNHFVMDVLAGAGTALAGVLIQQGLWRARDRTCRRRLHLPEPGELGSQRVAVNPEGTS